MSSECQEDMGVRCAIWWVRRDQRLTDNQALDGALAQAELVVPVFVLDPELLKGQAPPPQAGGQGAYSKRIAFLLGGLRQLDADLQDRGSRLVVRRGDPVRQLDAVANEVGAEAVFAEEDYWPYAVRRDARVAEALRGQGCPLHLVGGLTVHPPGAVKKADDTPYIVYTPFSKTWKVLPMPESGSVIQPPGKLPDVPPVESLTIPTEPELPEDVRYPPGELEAQRRLQAFVDPGAAGGAGGIYGYADGRNRLDRQGTSRLSPYLRFGMISARQAVVSALAAIEGARGNDARKGAEVWLNELIWREFYMSILYHFPYVLERSFREDLRDIEWVNGEEDFAAWCEGRTGYPVVDAAMRQLVQTGWMHNRARMIVASFLVKDLLVDWRWGERFFMEHLVDGDPAANNGGWQWTAGTGTDAAPYFRIFNPILQSKRHDPDGKFIRRWVPELAEVPDRDIHEPWKMDEETQRASGCTVGKDYPAPIVNHAWARERTLAVYGQAREDA
jgi:deoxyribodipyrimidine photo-lyase